MVIPVDMVFLVNLLISVEVSDDSGESDDFKESYDSGESDDFGDSVEFGDPDKYSKSGNSA